MRTTVTIRWTQTTLQGTPLNRWSASIETPVVIRGFASLNLEGGIWLLRIIRVAGHKQLCVTYASERLAKKHLERWVQYHWQTVGGLDMGESDRRGRGGRSSGSRHGVRVGDFLKNFDLYAPRHH